MYVFNEVLILPGMLLMLQHPRRSRVAPTSGSRVYHNPVQFKKTSNHVRNFGDLNNKVTFLLGAKYPQLVTILSKSLQVLIVCMGHSDTKRTQIAKLSTVSTELSTDLHKIWRFYGPLFKILKF